MERRSEEDPKEGSEVQGLLILREQCGVGARLCVLESQRLHSSPGVITQ